MKIVLFLTTILLLNIFSTPLIAQESTKPSKKNEYMWLLYGELGAAGIAYLASENPETYGTIIVLASPFIATFGETEKSNLEYWLTTAAVATYGAYNISLKDEKKETVFRNNFIFFSSIYITAFILKQGSNENKVNSKEMTYGITPISNGGLAFVNYRF